MATARILTLGFVIAVIVCIPHYQWTFEREFIQLFPLGWAAIGLDYMATFFHEIGHSMTAWYYGYFSVPMFDFKHGGGLAVWFGDPNPIILAGIWGALGYGIYKFRSEPVLFYGLILLLGFNLATFWNDDFRMSMIDYLGPAFEPLIASFLLMRALYDLAPRGAFERFLNAFFGFAMIFRTLIDSAGLIHTPYHREAYYNQKGAHGFGDFDKIAQRYAEIDFNMVVYSWAGLTLVCLFLPFILYYSDKYRGY